MSRDWAGRTHPHRSVDDEPELLGDIRGNPALGQLCLQCWCSANVARYGVLGVQEEPVQQLFAHVATLPAAVVKYDVRGAKTVPLCRSPASTLGTPTASPGPMGITDPGRHRADFAVGDRKAPPDRWSRSTETAAGPTSRPSAGRPRDPADGGGRGESLVQLSAAMVTSEMTTMSRSMVMSMSCQSLSNQSASSMS